MSVINPSHFIIDIAINEPAWENIIDEDRLNEELHQLFRQIVAHVCPWLREAEISIALINDSQIQELNKNYRHKDKPTNVLSFGNFEQPITINDIKRDQPLFLGDIALSLETLQQEASEQNKSFNHHLIHMFTHGFLHLLGYDHVQEQDAEVMESIEIAVLKGLGIDNPYEER